MDVLLSTRFDGVRDKIYQKSLPLFLRNLRKVRDTFFRECQHRLIPCVPRNRLIDWAAGGTKCVGECCNAASLERGRAGQPGADVRGYGYGDCYGYCYGDSRADSDGNATGVGGGINNVGTATLFNTIVAGNVVHEA